jgi:hypothetical protein
MSDRAIYKASDLADPRGRQEVPIGPRPQALAGQPPAAGVGFDGGGLLPVNQTMRDLAGLAKHPRWPGDPAWRPLEDARSSASTAVETPQEPPAASLTVQAAAPFVDDEAALRARLGDLLAEQRQAEEALRYSEQAHLRGEQHLADVTKIAAGFLRSEDQAAAALTAALRDGREPPDFDAGRAARDRAREDVVRATSACDALRAEHGKASAAVGNVKAAVSQCVAQVMAAIGEKLALERAAMVKQCDETLERLVTLAQALHGVTPGPTMQATLFPLDAMAAARPRDTSHWTAMAERLKGDPAATLTLD